MIDLTDHVDIEWLQLVREMIDFESDINWWIVKLYLLRQLEARVG